MFNVNSTLFGNDALIGLFKTGITWSVTADPGYDPSYGMIVVTTDKAISQHT